MLVASTPTASATSCWVTRLRARSSRRHADISSLLNAIDNSFHLREREGLRLSAVNLSRNIFYIEDVFWLSA
uniref:Uncharacterized protein n=1 Tax=Siphoviridae sp. ctPrm3 TaxID=2827864 RepID=A0A8S5TPD5_9CAUD|nr:MAG TPA: hypothetical protein [Siphoviridae sp. ctPrm3]